MATFKAFKIWYSDTTYTGTSYKDWIKAPSDNVQVVMLYFEEKDTHGRHTRFFSNGKDYYALNEKHEFSEHFNDIAQVNGHVLRGKYMDLDKLIQLEKQALADYGEGWLIEASTIKDDEHSQPVRWH